jgi:hypothetical protein
MIFTVFPRIILISQLHDILSKSPRTGLFLIRNFSAQMSAVDAIYSHPLPGPYCITAPTLLPPRYSNHEDD